MTVRVPPKALSRAFILQVVIDNQVTCNIRTRNGISVKDALAEKLENTGGRKWQNFTVYTKWTRVLIEWEIDVLCVRGHALIVVNKMDPSPLPLPGSHHFLPTELIQQAILPHSNKDFWYILRPSCQTPGQFALAISTPSWPTSAGILRHVKITFDEPTQKFSLCKKYFTDLDTLIDCFKLTPIKAHNGPNMYLRHPVPVDKRLEEDCKRRFKIYCRAEPDLEDEDNISLWSQGTPSCSYNYDASVSGTSDFDEDEDFRERMRSSTVVSAVDVASTNPSTLPTVIDQTDNPTFEMARKNLMLSFKNQHPQSRTLLVSPEPQTPAKEYVGSSDSDIIMRRSRSSNSSSSQSGSFGQDSIKISAMKHNKKESSDDLSKLSCSPKSTFASKLFRRKSPKEASRPQSEVFPAKRMDIPARSYSAAPKFGTQLSQECIVSPDDTYMTMELSASSKDLDSSLDMDFGETYETMTTIVRGSDPPGPTEVYEDMTNFNKTSSNISNNFEDGAGPDEAYEDMSSMNRWVPAIRAPEGEDSLPRVDSAGTYEDMSRLSPRPQSSEGHEVLNTISVHSIPSDQEVELELKEQNSTLTRANTTKPRRMTDEERRTLSRDRRAKSQYMNNKSLDQHQYDKPSSQHLYQNTGSLRKNHVISGNLEENHYDNNVQPHQYANTTQSPHTINIDRATSEKLISNVTYLMETVKQQAAEITALKKTVNQLKLGQKELEDELTSMSHNADFEY